MWLKYYDEESPISFFYLLFYFVHTIVGCNRNRYRESVRRMWKGILTLGEKTYKTAGCRTPLKRVNYPGGEFWGNRYLFLWQKGILKRK